MNNQAAHHEKIARDLRCRVLSISHGAKTPHIGSNLSLIDVLTVLYHKILRIQKSNNRKTFFKRDRLILSKGHGSLALYCALESAKILPRKFLQNYIKDGTLLPGHTICKPTIGLEAATGSLGHGLAIGLGMALASMKGKNPYKVFVVLSDGECNEGSVWEAIMAAGHWKVENLVAIIDYNKIQSFGTTKRIMDIEPLKEKIESFNWGVKEVDGHDVCALAKTLSRIPFRKNCPSALIAHTVKGKGVSFMENTVDWHYKNLTDELLEKAIKEVVSCR